VNPDRQIPLYCRMQIRDCIDPTSLHKVEAVDNPFHEIHDSKNLKTLDVLVDGEKYATIASGEITLRKPASL
jgi:hypothetical protein